MRSFLLISSFFVATFAQARLYNYSDLPVGERAAGMGMTAIAASSDVGDAFLNPAAVADLQAPMIGASVSSYTRLDARTGESVSLLRSLKDSLARGAVESTPAFVGGNFNTRGWVWGGGVVMPSTLSFNGTLKPEGDEVISYSAKSRSTNLLVFVSKRWGSFSYGASLTTATLTEEERSFKLVSADPNVTKNTEYYYSLNTLLSGLGAVWDVAPGWRVGFSSSIPIGVIGGEGSFAEVESGASEHAVESFTMRRHPFPVRLSGGVEWTPRPSLTFAADVHWYGGFDRNLAPGAPNSLLRVEGKSITNFNVGAQWRGWTRVGLRWGALTNLSSSNKRFSRYATLQDSVNLYGGTMSVYFPTPNGSISIGGFFQGGEGRMANIAKDTGSVETVRRSIYIYGAVLGSTYLFL